MGHIYLLPLFDSVIRGHGMGVLFAVRRPSVASIISEVVARISFKV